MSMAAPPAWLRVSAESLTVEVTARPGSSRRGVIGSGPRGLIVAVHAQAADGRANRELIEVLADTLSVPRSSIAIEHGARGRSKLIRVASAAPSALATKLSGLALKS